MLRFNLILLISTATVFAGTVNLPIQPPREATASCVLDVRLESLAEKIRTEGFPRVLAGTKELSGLWVEDIDADGQCSPPDNLVGIIPSPIPKSLTLVFDDPNRKPSLVTGKEITNQYVEKTPAYSATVIDGGGVLKSLKNASGEELLTSPLQFRLWSGGFCRTTGEMDLALYQVFVTARLRLVESPVRKTLICRYNLDEYGYPTNMGPVRAGLKGAVIYKFFSDRIGVEHRMLETDAGNFPYQIREELNLTGPERMFTTFSARNRPGEKTVTGAITSDPKGWEGPVASLPAWLSFKGPRTHIGIVYEPPGWQGTMMSDGRRPKWGDFIALAGFFDGLANQFWLVLGDRAESRCEALSRPVMDRNAFRAPLESVTRLERKIRVAQTAVEQLAPGLWAVPARVQLESAKAFFALADHCQTIHRPEQSRRLAREGLSFAERAETLACQIEREGWLDPGQKNTTGQPAFTRGVYWPWGGCPERQERRAEFLHQIGVDCVHNMDIQVWPEVERELTAKVVDAADFRASRNFLDLAGRHHLTGLLLAMDPFWPNWGNRLPFYGAPDDFVNPPSELIQSARWVETYVRRLKDHPALAGYVIHNEPGCGDFDGKNPAEVRRSFVKWLKKRYPSLDALNQTWRTHYKDWADIVPPDLAGAKITQPGTVPMTTQPGRTRVVHRALAYDWVTFRQKCYMNHLAYLKDVAVRLDPARPAFSKLYDANLVRTYAADPREGGRAHYKVYGSNYYYGPQTGTVGHGVGNMNLMFALTMDFERTFSGLPIWCTEFNQGWWKPYRMSTRGDFLTQVWTGLGKGLRGLFPFAMSPGQWSLFYGDDAPTPAGEAMTLFYAQTRALDGLIAGLGKPKPQIAFYYPQASFYQRDLDNPSHPERPLSTPINQFRALYESLSLVGGFTVGFLADEDLAAGKLDTVQALVLIEAEYLPRTVLPRLRDFVARGGRLIMVGPVARFDEYGFTAGADTASDLAAVLGAKPIRQVPSPVSAAGKTIWLPPSDPNISAITFIRLQPEVKVVAAYADNKPAAIEHGFAKGNVLTIGCCTGVTTDARPGATAEFLTDWLETQNLRPAARTTNFFETSRNNLAVLGLKDAQNRDWLLLANADVNPLNPTLKWNAPYAPTAVNVLNGQILPCTRTKDNQSEFTLRLDSYEVALIGSLNRKGEKP